MGSASGGRIYPPPKTIHIPKEDTTGYFTDDMMVSMFLSTEILMMLGNTVSELTERLD